MHESDKRTDGRDYDDSVYKYNVAERRAQYELMNDDGFCRWFTAIN